MRVDYSIFAMFSYTEYICDSVVSGIWDGRVFAEIKKQKKNRSEPCYEPWMRRGVGHLDVIRQMTAPSRPAR
jgi:hypothetical protein